MPRTSRTGAAPCQRRRGQDRAGRGAGAAALAGVAARGLRGMGRTGTDTQPPGLQPRGDGSGGNPDRGRARRATVANELGRALGDDWVLLRGYKNSSGEIDHLLLGPGGLFAMEVKHRNATVYVDGDEWRFEKYDRFGNLVEEGRITDRGGRSPSRQVNDSADTLQRFLTPGPAAGRHSAHRHPDPSPVRTRQPPQPHRLGGHLRGFGPRPGCGTGADAAASPDRRASTADRTGPPLPPVAQPDRCGSGSRQNGARSPGRSAMTR